MHLLSTLPLCLALFTTNGFGPSATRIRKNGVYSGLSKYATNSETAEGSSSKIRQMSWFLTTQLLETALREASKGEDGSKISMDDIQKLADVLQRTEDDILQRNAVTSELDEEPVASESDDAENDVLLISNKEETVTGEDRAKENNTDANITNTQWEDDSTEVSDARNERVNSSVQNEPASSIEAQQTDASESCIETAKESDEKNTTEKGVEQHEETNIESGIGAIQEKSDVEATNESITESEMPEVGKIGLDTLDSEDKKTENVSQRLGAARIPDVISRAYGRSLEVVSSDVPPLRDSLIPKGSDELPSMQPSQKSQDERQGEASE